MLITWWKIYIWLIGRIIIISKSFQDNTLTNQGDYIVSSIPNVSLNSEATSVKVIIKKNITKMLTKYTDTTRNINADTKKVIVANSQWQFISVSMFRDQSEPTFHRWQPSKIWLCENDFFLPPIRTLVFVMRKYIIILSDVKKWV